MNTSKFSQFFPKPGGEPSEFSLAGIVSSPKASPTKVEPSEFSLAGIVSSPKASPTTMEFSSPNPPSPKAEPHSTIQPQQPAMAPSEPHNIQVQNVVATVAVGCELDLQNVYFRTRNTEYNPRRFHAVTMRLREPRCTGLIFRTGKVVVTGARTEAQAHLAARKFARILQKLGYAVKFIDFKVQNIVATVDLRFPLQLERLALRHSQFCSYEPEIFPGVVYRMVRPHMVILIFVNGKIVFTGAKTRADIMECLRIMHPILASYSTRNINENLGSELGVVNY